MKKLFAFCALTATLSVAWAQETSCVQTLRLAQSTYEQGRLHELPGLLAACLKSGFTDEEKRQAYLLLTMSYIYLEEPEEADGAMLSLLQTDHFFEIDANVHPAEFIALYRKFRTQPLFRLGANIAPGLNFPSVVTDFAAGQMASGSGRYSPRIGTQFTLSFEKDFIESKHADPSERHYKLTIAPEISFAIRGFSYAGDFVPSDLNPEEPSATIETIQKINRIELNPLVKWNLKKAKLNPYLVAGPGISYLVTNTFTGTTTRRLGGEGTVSGADIDALSVGRPITFSGIVGIGGKARLGGVYVMAEVRYQHGLSNFINTDQRNNPELLYDYGLPMDDLRTNSTSVHLGILYAVFKPKKLIK